MSYKGIITRGEYDRGITLNAKVVSPNKKYSSSENFPVIIKANAMSDMEKVLAALNEHKTSLLELGEDLNDLSYDISDILVEGDSFGYKTSTTYVMSSPLNEFINDKGEIIGRPKYGTEDVSGAVSITTSLNGVKMTTHVPITIKAVDIEDIFNDSRLSIDGLWEKISNGQNKSHIYKALSLIETMTLDDLSDTNLSITWNITDSAIGVINSYEDVNLGYVNLNYDKRLNTDGTITMIPYPIIYGTRTNLNNAGITINTSNSGTSSSQIRYFDVGGITLKAIIRLGEEEQTLSRTFNLLIRSELLTASEIFSALNVTSDKIFQYTVTGEGFNNIYPVNSNVSPYVIAINSSTQTELRFTVQANGENISCDAYGLDSIISLFHTARPKILAGNDSSSTDYSTTFSSAIFSTPIDDGSGNYVFTMNSTNLKALVDTTAAASKFTVALNFGTSGYPVDGTSIATNGGIGTQSGTAYICFNILFTD